MTLPAVPDVTTGLDAELARLGVTGALRTGPLGSTLPTSMTPWAAPIINLGYISDDGITESRSEERTEFTSWQSLTPIRTELTTRQTTFQATLWETNWNTISLYYQVGLDDVTLDETGTEDVLIFD